MSVVYFYKLRLFEEQLVKEETSQDKYTRNYKSNQEAEKLFKGIILNNSTMTLNRNKCIPIEDAPDWILTEILNFNKCKNFDNVNLTQCDIMDAEYIFGRIGKKKDITNVQKRNRYTFEPEDIEKDPDQDIEIYTYFYLFFDTSIIVYLGAQAAPSIKKIEDMVKRYYNSINLRAEVVPVTAEDMIEILVHKDIVNSFEVTTTLPSDEILNVDAIGLSESLFDKLRDEKNMKITVSISADGRNKNLFKNKNYIRDIVNCLIGGRVGKTRRLKFKAKNSNEHIQEYDIIDKMFTKSVQFTYKADEGEKRRKEIEETLFRLYYENRDDIIRYCRD
ncbi:hypothetical protein [Mahella australiensis]|uniref:Uncharacterized protein n=1 Tax=Mahella australiensis (strain DSM 15567 / CIP 107919 / 50-1 BON) TaxID=697281 RepID=F3ZVF3_MAHA5|nr:hypothetical protein [Mahella australiensis]AEE95303.1 hypothetical protein Mahau_0080 [Mahella australiensis 50-1 BON]